MGLFISAAARSNLKLRKEPWVAPGKVKLPDFRAARLLAMRVSDQLEAEGLDPSGVSAGSVHALELIEDSLQALLLDYLERRDPGFLDRSLTNLEKRLGPEALDEALTRFSTDFLTDGSESESLSRTAALLDVLLMWAQQGNPAAAAITTVLHGGTTLHDTDLLEAIELLSQTAPKIADPTSENDVTAWEILLAPHQASPDSLLGQLQFLKRRWSEVLGERAPDLQAGLDLFAEEMAPRFPPGPGPIEAPALTFEGEEEAQIRFSTDLDWMPRLVLIAKNAYVWLDQLSRGFADPPLRHLDDIPDLELERLAATGITGLWLIGVWERSVASRKIKRRCGNPEAEASAYSLRRYQIAEDLGGEPALERLRTRASSFGIRLAADMVPNHMGIDSDWVLDYPERFLATDELPFPSYTFAGPDLSEHDSVGLFIEDHYYNRSDAAVVFKRTHYGTGETRYIYHGNDGTTMPWNDTAQLDYLNPDVREAVIRTILDVARRFPVIRFDAAMTLAKRHFQRLWFPEPGTAGAIPSRAEHGLSNEQFHRLMPEEFWREVVDRVAEEVPDTLLLAEAFWLMEGYFVRSLGMHRVYNSAFMNMLKDEENHKYRRLIKETLVFDPRILQRYVNFMSNPDEETAVEHFGKGDRYFGVCVLMATLPGLPMFAHGQFEGFAEKYGMEYRRAYKDETPDPELIARHEREIAPLLARRGLFAGVEHFRLFDLVREDGSVDENVFAYANGTGESRVLVLFNNKFQNTRGRIHRSSPTVVGDPEAGALVESPLVEALGLAGEDGPLVAFRDAIARLDYLVSAPELAEGGLEVKLEAYNYRVLRGFRSLGPEPDASYLRLAAHLGGSGVPNLEAARRSLLAGPLRDRWDAEVQPLLLEIHGALADESAAERMAAIRERFATALTSLARESALLTGADLEEDGSPEAGDGLEEGDDTGESEERLVAQTLDRLEALELWSREPKGARAGAAEDYSSILSRHSPFQAGALTWLGFGATALDPQTWELESTLRATLETLGMDAEATGSLYVAMACGIDAGWGQAPTEPPQTAGSFLRELLSVEETREAVGTHTYRFEEFVNREALETLLHWRLAVELLAWTADPEAGPEDVRRALGGWLRTVLKIEAGAAVVGYRTDELLDRLDSREKRL